jgi:hypothetical protein
MVVQAKTHRDTAGASLDFVDPYFPYRFDALSAAILPVQSIDCDLSDCGQLLPVRALWVRFPRSYNGRLLLAFVCLIAAAAFINARQSHIGYLDHCESAPQDASSRGVRKLRLTIRHPAPGALLFSARFLNIWPARTSHQDHPRGTPTICGRSEGSSSAKSTAIPQ